MEDNLIENFRRPSTAAEGVYPIFPRHIPNSRWKCLQMITIELINFSINSF